MLLVKKGYPEEDEFVLCTITNIQYHCVFAKLDEYDNKSGMIHISEIASGRIRNIREYVREGKKVVCKVLRISLDKGHIDLSLRRVNDAQRRIKTNEIKQQQSAEKIIELVAKTKKIKPLALLNKLYKAVLTEYPSIYACFEDVVREDANLAKLGLEKDLAREVESVVRQRVKPPEIHIAGDIYLSSFDSNGLDLIKKALAKAKATNVTIKYKAAGTYTIDAQGEDPKTTDKRLAKSVVAVEQFAKKNGLVMKFVRREE